MSLIPYSTADNLTRAWEYGATMNRILRAWNTYGDDVVKRSRNFIDTDYGMKFKFDTPEEKFLAESGLRQFTQEQQRHFLDVYEGFTKPAAPGQPVSPMGREAAIRWASTTASQERMFRYGAANQVAAFRTSVGRLFGQFGVWPQWYLMYLAKGLAGGTGADKVRFIRNLAAAYAGIYYTADSAGLDPLPWLAFPSRVGIPAPGPLFKVGVDALVYASDMLSGKGVPYGIEDIGTTAGLIPGIEFKTTEMTGAQQTHLSRLRQAVPEYIVPTYSFFNRDIPTMARGAMRTAETFATGEPSGQPAYETLLSLMSIRPAKKAR
jgi:hypothetical protein